jgi:hypothetical protein
MYRVDVIEPGVCVLDEYLIVLNCGNRSGNVNF